MPWDNPCQAELATDLETREAVKLAQFSYETTYHRTGKWPELNPMVRQHWIEITLAILKSLRILAVKKPTTETRRHGEQPGGGE
jgi:hypothetical protein